jgi:hypothetical protein
MERFMIFLMLFFVVKSVDQSREEV